MEQPAPLIGPENHPPAAVEQVAASRMSESRWRKKALAIAAMVGVGLTGGCSLDPFGTTPGRPNGSQHNAGPTLTETPLPARVNADYKAALAKDTCAAKVSLSEATSTYQHLFGYQVPTNLDTKDLVALANGEIKDVTAARKQAGYIPLPTNFGRLAKDAESGRDAIPVATYRQTFDSYMHRFGIQTLYSWKRKSIMYGIPAKPAISPVSDLAHNLVVRIAMVEEMRSFANTPPERAKTIKRIAMGIMQFGGASSIGEALVDDPQHTMLVDIFRSESLKRSDKIANEALLGPHELAHYIAYDDCPPLLFGNQVDGAYAALNRGFTYGTDTESSLEKRNRTKGKYVSLNVPYSTDNLPKGTVVVGRPYGGIWDSEDTATSFGELLINRQSTPDLFVKTGDDDTPLKEKIALSEARDAKVTHDVNTQRVDSSQARLAVIQAASSDRMTTNDRAIDSALHQALSGKYALNPDHDPAVQRLEAVRTQYQTINRQLARAAVVGS